MNAKPAATYSPPRASSGSLRAIAGHLISLILPTACFICLLTGPHDWDAALLWTLPVWLFILADVLGPSDRSNPPAELPVQPFIAILLVLAAFQIVNIALMLDLVRRLTWTSAADIAAGFANLFALRILVGTNSCCCGIAVAHELIHRPQRFWQLLGRLLLCLVCYEHFAVEHIRGHHRHASTPEDPASALFGECYNVFWRRTAVAQFKSAWRLENMRLGMSRNAAFDVRLLRHEVFQGVMLESGVLALIGWYFGWLAATMFLLQALAAVRLLEAVNYFQHWGLLRQDKRFSPRDAWVTDSWFTLHAFVGLARHADHHVRPAKPYQTLNYSAAGPKLPCGYFGTALLAKSFNRCYQRLAIRELEARRLGPFRKLYPLRGGTDP